MRNGYAPLLLIVLLLSACGKRSSLDEAVYQTVTDSVDRFSPQAKAMILSHLDEARDSDACYAWLSLLGKYYFLTGHDSAEILSDSVIRYVRHAKQPTPRLKRCESLAWQFKAARMQRACAPADSIIPLFINGYNALKESGCLTFLPWQSANIGYNYFMAGRIPEASTWLHRAFYLADSLHSSPSMTAPIHSMMGTLYTQTGDMKAAGHEYRKAYALCDSMALRDRINFFINYSVFLDEEKRYQDIIRHLGRLRTVLEENDLTESLESHFANMNLAGAYVQTDSLDKAAALLDMDSAFQAAGNQEGLYNLRSIRMQIALKKGDMAAMDRLVATDTLGDVMPYQHCSRAGIMTEYYRRKGDYRRAYELQEWLNRYQDSVAKATTDIRIEEMATRFQSDTLALHHQLLKAEKKRTESRMRTGIIVLLALVVITALALLVKSLRWRKRSLQDEMTNMRLRLDRARSSISPHFIFNVLSREAEQADEEKQSRLMRLASLINQNLDVARKSLVTLEEELSFVDDYVEVERSIIPGGIIYEKDIEDEALLQTAKVPSMFVQILVENAIKHGLKNLSGEKRLRVKASRQEGGVTVTVEDNGQGFDIRKSTQMASGRMGLSIIRNSIAVYNRHRKSNKLSLDITNLHDSAGRVTGCRSCLSLPEDLEDLSCS